MRSRRLVQLGPEHAQAALAYCATSPVRATFIAGWITDGGLAHDARTPRAWLFADLDDSAAIVGLAYISDTGIVLPMLELESVGGLVDVGRRNPQAIRVLVGEREQIAEIWRQLRPMGFKSRIERDQLGYATDRVAFTPQAAPSLVRATVTDLDHLVEASAAMAREEAKDDPQSRNPTLFRQRIRERIERGRDFLYTENGSVTFKCNVSALSPLGGQIEGIYTLPGHRRSGIGRAGTSAVTAWVLERAERAFLLVNDDNTIARDLYASLGYRVVQESRTIFVAP